MSLSLNSLITDGSQPSAALLMHIINFLLFSTGPTLSKVIYRVFTIWLFPHYDWNVQDRQPSTRYSDRSVHPASSSSGIKAGPGLVPPSIISINSQYGHGTGTGHVSSTEVAQPLLDQASSLTISAQYEPLVPSRLI